MATYDQDDFNDRNKRGLNNPNERGQSAFRNLKMTQQPQNNAGIQQSVVLSNKLEIGNDLAQLRHQNTFHLNSLYEGEAHDIRGKHREWKNWDPKNFQMSKASIVDFDNIEVKQESYAFDLCPDPANSDLGLSAKYKQLRAQQSESQPFHDPKFPACPESLFGYLNTPSARRLDIIHRKSQKPSLFVKS